MASQLRAPLDVPRLRRAVPGWPPVRVVESVGSTNDVLLADSAAPDRTVLAAEEQTAGRGRLDRGWSSPARAGVWFSVLLRPTTPVARRAWLSLLTGVAVCEAVVDVTAAAVTLKWPNDLLCNTDGKKVGGILAQAAGDAVVVGVGLNVSTRPDELPTDTGTSLERCSGDGAPVDRTSLLIAVLTAFDRWETRWSGASGDAGASGLAEAYTARCSTIGREVLVRTTAADVLRGMATGVDPDGRLLIDTADGRVVIAAGDVEHLRAAG